MAWILSWLNSGLRLALGVPLVSAWIFSSRSLKLRVKLRMDIVLSWLFVFAGLSSSRGFWLASCLCLALVFA